MNSDHVPQDADFRGAILIRSISALVEQTTGCKTVLVTVLSSDLSQQSPFESPTPAVGGLHDVSEKVILASNLAKQLGVRPDSLSRWLKELKIPRLEAKDGREKPFSEKYLPEILNRVGKRRKSSRVKRTIPTTTSVSQSSIGSRPMAAFRCTICKTPANPNAETFRCLCGSEDFELDLSRSALRNSCANRR